MRAAISAFSHWQPAPGAPRDAPPRPSPGQAPGYRSTDTDRSSTSALSCATLRQYADHLLGQAHHPAQHVDMVDGVVQGAAAALLLPCAAPPQVVVAVTAPPAEVTDAHSALPASPLSSSFFRLLMGGRKRFWAIIASFLPLSSRARSISSHSSSDAAIGFSQTTFLPERRLLMEMLAWTYGGVQTSTKSISRRSRRGGGRRDCRKRCRNPRRTSAPFPAQYPPAPRSGTAPERSGMPPWAPRKCRPGPQWQPESSQVSSHFLPRPPCPQRGRVCVITSLPISAPGCHCKSHLIHCKMHHYPLPRAQSVRGSRLAWTLASCVFLKSMQEKVRDCAY